jgi:transcriptional regulator with XRE-family HTH domain
MAAKSKQSEDPEEGKDVLRVGLGVALRECRKQVEPKLTQAELSARAGLPSNAIGDLERGERAIKGEELKSICKVLGIQLKAFMERVVKEQLRALGEPKSAEELDGGAASAKVPDLYLTMALAGNTPEEAIRIMHRMIRARGPASPEDEG